ncbi:MAG: alpha/beta hydrolase [Aggregatilineales bacterium]
MIPPDTSKLYKTPEGHAAFEQWYAEALEKLPVPFETRYVETRYGVTHMLVMGPADAPPLVMVQGYGASAPLYYKQFADFARQHRVYALDTPGHPGRSAPNPPPLLGDGYAIWLVDVFDALGLARTHVVGACLGGWAVLRLGVYAPERIDKAVLLSPVGLARFKVYVRSGVPFILNIGGDIEAAGQRLIVNAFTPPGSNLTFDRQLAKALLLAIKHYRVGLVVGYSSDRPTPREFARSLRILRRFVHGETVAELRKFSAPALLLVGEHEAIYNPRAAVRKAAAAMPNVQAEIVPGTGHAAIYDRPDYVNPRVLAFLNGTSKQFETPLMNQRDGK